MIALLEQYYDPRFAENIFEVLRAWLNNEPISGWRFGPLTSHWMMLIAGLVLVFLLEILITIGMQIWERRVLGRMQSRWGPRMFGNVTPAALRRVALPIIIMLAIPALCYGLEYWTTAGLAPFQLPGGLLTALGITSATVALTVYLIRFDKRWTGLARLALYPWYATLAAVPAVWITSLLPPVVFPGRSLEAITWVLTIAAFITYAVYMFGYYWRQGLADAVKLFFKEDVVPLNADRFLFTIAPMLVYLPALLSWIVIPFGTGYINGRQVYFIVQDLNVGLLLIIADFALFLVAIIMSGYASNNKYALVGAMREAAMLLTYEIPMLMSLLCVALFAGSLNLTEIVQRQTMTWGILPLLPAFAIYLVIALAETNRPPFDLPEAQNELLGGYLVEYSGLRFALFYIAEYSNVFIVSAIMSICFLGGWKGPMFLGPEGLWLTSLFWFLLKTYCFVFFFIWARATMPRIRIDQIMFFSWKFLLPASVGALALTALGVVNRHPWFSANRIWEAEFARFNVLSTPEALAQLTAGERAFFWGYLLVTILFTLFILWLAWRVLFANTYRHPLPRREVTWSS